MKTDKSGEFEIIDRLTKHFPNAGKNLIAGPGDDCAVFEYNTDLYQLATCDVQVEGIHFLANTSSTCQIGEKAIAVNVSDIAAMGGTPTFCLISLILPETSTNECLDNLYKGILRSCKKYGIQIAGGNISRGKEFSVDIFMLGQVKKKEILFRTGGKPGDKILVTGTLGDAALGMVLLQNKNNTLTVKQKANLIKNQLTPTPRLEEARIIAKLKKATSMIDISDGLSADMMHLCTGSNVGVQIYEYLLPISEEVKKAAVQINQSYIQLALSGGEDYELLFTLPPEDAIKTANLIRKQTGIPVTIIGEFLPKNEGLWLIQNNGKRKPMKSTGWDHFK